jgi:DNA-directed RNA polymerase subunit RPC12/RpoP
MAVYMIIAVLVGALAIVTLAALVLGLLGAGGLVNLVRCTRCAHLVIIGRDDTNPICPYCRHKHLAHPLTTLRHPRRELLRH